MSLPCPSCTSSDAFVLYENGGYCFSCNTSQRNTKGAPIAKKLTAKDVIPAGSCDAIPQRKLTAETCHKYSYKTGYQQYIADFFNPEGTKIIWQKIRKKGKKFSTRGVVNKTFFGQHLFDSGKKLVITEGEYDCMTMSQVQGNKWPVVSLPNGCSSAASVFKANLEWLEGFDTIILMFDMDEPGQKATSEVVDLLSAGKVHIAKLPLKDASEMLVAGRVDELVSAMWNAKKYAPDGIVAGIDIWESIIEESNAETTLYPWEGLNSKTFGMRTGEVVVWTAGTGVGKSQILREVSHDLVKRGEKVGIVALEETVKKTAIGLMSIEANLPLHLNTPSKEELHEYYKSTVGSGNVFLYDHFGSMDPETLLAKIRYMVKAHGCKWVILDHLSIVISGLGDGDERRLIDNFMTAIVSFIQENNIGMHLIVHLRKSQNDKGHEEGARVHLSDLRGSGSIAQLADIVIANERNKQSATKSNETTIRVLKNRFNGDEGVACKLNYDKATGRLTEIPATAGFNNELPDDEGDF